MKYLMAATALLGTVVIADQAVASSKIFSSGVSRLNGRIETTASGNIDPFIVQVFTTGNECLRIAVVAQGAADLEATLVSPSGRVWQDDDSNGSLRPLIKAITDVRGWYPLMLAHYVGHATNENFSLDIERLASSNVRCSPPTSARVNTAPARAKTGASGQAVPGGPQ